MARMVLVILVALINLGLGFAVATQMGRGPWARRARKPATKPVPQPLPQSASQSHPTQRVSKSIEQIAVEMEALESRFQELLKRQTETSTGPVDPAELQWIVRESLAQVESLAVDELSAEHPEQVAAGMRTLLLELQTAATELDAVMDEGDSGSLDATQLITRLLMACRQVGVVFNALMFAELPN